MHSVKMQFGEKIYKLRYIIIAELIDRHTINKTKLHVAYT